MFGLKKSFKEVFFRKIIESLKYELGLNLDDDKAERIVFCISYLQLHINNLLEKHKKIFLLIIDRNNEKERNYNK